MCEMKHRSKLHKLKAKQDRSVIPYPPGYEQQSLTKELVLFSDHLLTCVEEYREIFTILLNQFEIELECGDSKPNRYDLEAIANNEQIIRHNEDLPTGVFVSVEEQFNRIHKSVLRIMKLLDLIELNRISDDESGAYRDEAC